ncbi:DUF2612 domain-containing protein [Duodenibacillus massiliensis]|jgi:hypothetical protein|uniref:DUF2612 domain-containing protein n=1 Tax=Duodenibacillus massiliensis TaxID=1852381 RepID=UPI0020663A05|nr:MAG TPA_asm: Protein of unknown function (DUF2612) [Caudoviricetes sp.]
MSDSQTWQNFESAEDVREMADVTSRASVAMQSQYAHAPRMNAVGKILQDEIDATDQLDDIAVQVADVQTAKGVFLDWWGKRIGIDRYIKVKDKYVRFDDDYFRFLLMYRAVCNVSDSTCATMNRMLSLLTNTKVFCVDYQDMTISSVVVIGAISDVMSTVLATYGLLNRPAGVLANYLIIYPNEEIFGFQGSDLLPFNQGVFNPGRTIQV